MLASGLRRVANALRKLIPLSLAEVGRIRAGAPAGERFPFRRTLIGNIDVRSADLRQQPAQTACVLEILFRRTLEKPQPAPRRRQAQSAFLEGVAQDARIARKAVTELRGGVAGCSDFVQNPAVVDRRS